MRKLQVLDLSHYQTVANLNGMKAAGIVGVIHKATEGVVTSIRSMRRAGSGSSRTASPSHPTIFCVRPLWGRRCVITWTRRDRKSSFSTTRRPGSCSQTCKGPLHHCA